MIDCRPDEGIRGPTAVAEEPEEAPEVQARPAGRAIVLDAPALGSLYYALCERLGLIEIHEPRQWKMLKHVAPALGKG